MFHLVSSYQRRVALEYVSERPTRPPLDKGKIEGSY